LIIDGFVLQLNSLHVQPVIRSLTTFSIATIWRRTKKRFNFGIREERKND